MIAISVTEIVRAPGAWDVSLSLDTPKQIVDMLRSRDGGLGRVVVDVARDNPHLLGDSLLGSARYVGVLHQVDPDSATAIHLAGVGMGWWLGDAQKNTGQAFETALTFTGASFASAIADLIPSALTAGSITPPTVGGSYTGTHQWQVPREAIDYICDLFTCDWRVNGDATVDAGPPEDLFVAVPQAAIVAKTDGGDQLLRGLRGTARLESDLTDYSTRVVTIAEGQGRTVQVGSAEVVDNPYRDPQGNPVQITRLVSESNTSLTNADARAQVQLDKYSTPRTSVTLTTDAYDIRGDVAAGDSVWCYDPDAGLVDDSNQVRFRGDLIFPVKLRVFQLTWSITPGMGVYFRDTTGKWWDLTDWVVWESTGQTTVTVGGYDRAITDAGTEPVGSRVVADNSVPAAPTLSTPFVTSVYQSANGASRARIVAAWTQPANTDGSAIVDGDHYDIQYRSPAGSGDWTTQAVGFDQLQGVVRELMPATEYGLRVRAVDTANPPNFGAWTAEETVVTAGDTIAPATPAAPSVAGNPVSIQILHTLGMASGGTYNLDPDLHHLEVHASASGAGFTADETTKLGEVAATQGMMSSTVPAIASFTVASTSTLYVKVVAVDESGNRSAASAAATATASLIDSAHISDVVASLITTGNLNAVLALVGAIQTGASGARWRADSTGWKTYRPSGTLALWNDSSTGDLIAYQTNGTTPTFKLEASTGNVYLYKSNGTTPALQLTASTGLIDLIGKLTAGAATSSGARIVLDPSFVGPGGTLPTELFYSTSGTIGPGRLNAIDSATVSGGTGVGLNSGPSQTGSSFRQSTCVLYPDGGQLVYGDQLVNPRGGDVEVDSGGTYIAAFNSSGTEKSSVAVNSDGTITATGDDVATITGLAVGLRNGSSSAYLDINANGSLSLVGANGGFFDVSSAGVARVVSNSVVKSFVIDHPNNNGVDPDRLLVHACTESPQSAVEYAGVADIVDGRAVVTLPDYFDALTEPGSAVVTLSPEVLDVELTHPGGMAVVMPSIPQAAHTPVVDGRFTIVCPTDGARVHWRVYAVRRDVPQFEVEPLKATTVVRGDGPYRYIVPPAA